jgi:enamine deaminase RidA (YjgF/YER057c/UK114 family)
MNQSRASSAKIRRFTKDNLDVVALWRPRFEKFYINVHPDKNRQHYSMFEKLGSFLREHNARIVAQDVFGSCELYPDGINALESSCGKINWPVTWIEGYGRPEKSLTGTQAYAISGTDVESIRLDKQIIGSIFEDDDAQYCLLGDLRPNDVCRSRTEQASATFERIEAALRLVGMDFSNVVRTWMYINQILCGYDEFNVIRTKFFNERGIFQGVVPASTGIGVANPAGAALVAEAFAIKAKNNNVSSCAVPSPLQCPAIDYKSSFSRAVEVTLSDHRRLYISGTASIGPDGKTAYAADTENQIARTMEVVQAILESCRMGWADTSRAVAYFKDIEKAPMLEKYCKGKRLPSMPIVVAHGDICREELLFEIELDAIQKTNG